jgi:hypothetical protein
MPLCVTTMANRENAARRRGRLLPSYAAGLMALSNGGSVLVSSFDLAEGEGFVFVCPDLGWSATRRADLCVRGRWLEFWLQHPIVRNSTAPLFEYHHTPPVDAAAAIPLRPSWLIQGWRDEGTHSRPEMGRAEEQEFQIPSRSLDRRRRCRIHGCDGRAPKCRQI